MAKELIVLGKVKIRLVAMLYWSLSVSGKLAFFMLWTKFGDDILAETTYTF
jgi:hypothetical protein